MEKRLRKGILRSRGKKIFYPGWGVKINRTDNIDGMRTFNLGWPISEIKGIFLSFTTTELIVTTCEKEGLVMLTWIVTRQVVSVAGTEMHEVLRSSLNVREYIESPLLKKIGCSTWSDGRKKRKTQVLSYVHNVVRELGFLGKESFSLIIP